MTLSFGSVCSGIEAASVAWAPLGWRAAWLSETDPFACAVLDNHYPEVPNLGDMTTLPQSIRRFEVEAPDVLCGGTPCQSFSLAGARESLADTRGSLTLTFCDIADAIDEARRDAGFEPCIIFWENVPGVLSTRDNAFGCFLGRLVGEDCPLEPPGGRWTHAGCVLGPKRAVAWRTLDAQYFGLAQRRKRVFVVASARRDFDPAAVLFEPKSVHGDTPARRKMWPETAAAIAVCSNAGGGNGPRRDVDGIESPQVLEQPYRVANCLTARMHKGFNTTISEGQTPVISIRTAQRFGVNADGAQPAVAYAFDARQSDVVQYGDISGTLDTDGMPVGVLHRLAVRRLTPRECERLQGFPDDYTLVPYRGKPAADGPRYRAIGNSWAVPVVRWIGTRIKQELLRGL